VWKWRRREREGQGSEERERRRERVCEDLPFQFLNFVVEFSILGNFFGVFFQGHFGIFVCGHQGQRKVNDKLARPYFV
jgi:hypothetical protein